ncbi:translation initiation factor IF-2-like [Cervus elaphus]|uniref:translation initiation factor IF-2-like n=1 Tax=Cervus elaphus TaxID=9860 RepID=UPI001CC3175E|nr:translation initiation factor IF-2-like [Cervus elaphus]
MRGKEKRDAEREDTRAGPHTSRAPGVSAPRGKEPRQWAGAPGSPAAAGSAEPRHFRLESGASGRGGAARAPRPRPLRGPAPEGARFPRPACSPRASLRVSGSASPGPNNVAAAADKPVGQRPPGGNGACRTPPLAIRPRGERQGALSPGWETHSPARAPGPLRPSPLPRTSPRALKYTVREQALGSGTRRPGRATCPRLARSPPPGRSRPAPGPSARGRAPAAFPAPPRPAPAPRPPSALQALPAASPGPPVCLSSLAGVGRTLGGSGRGTGGGPGCREAPLPLRASPRMGTWEGGPQEACRQLRPWLGVTSTFPRRTDCPGAQCFRSGIPALGPAAARRERECPVPAGKLRAGPAGLPGPLPCQSLVTPFSEILGW